MAKDQSSDVLMMFTLKGKPIPASCQTVFTKEALTDANTLLKGFQPGCFFEIEDVDLDVTGPSADSPASGKSRKGVQLGEVSVTRQIDKASMVLMQCCIDSQDLDSAVVVKRRAVGGSNESGQPYLRMQFDGVLIRKVDWSDQHVVKETVTFISRSVEVQYRPQAADGSLGKPAQAKWTMPA